MWRDVERRAAMYGIAWSAIPPYPLRDLAFPNRIALLGVKEGWCAEYVTAAYRRWFVGGEDASTESNILDSSREIGQEPDRVLALAASDQMKATLQMETDTARALGIFGAPTFVTARKSSEATID